MRNVVVMMLIGTLAGVAACSRHAGSRSAVEEAIQKHLNQNPRLSFDAFTTSIETVTFKGDTAEARVKFTSKQNPSLAVEVGYGLKKVGNQWEVISSTPLSGQDSQHVPLDQRSTGLPPGHPPVAPAQPAPEASH